MSGPTTCIGGEAQGHWVMDNYPNGATLINLQGQPGASPAIDRNKGLHNVLDAHKDKYKFSAEQTANFARDQGLSVTESLLASQSTPPDVIVCANDDMALGALEAVKGRNLQGKIKVIGFDALPEALGSIRDGGLSATVEQFPGGQSRKAVDVLAEYLKTGKPPEKDLDPADPHRDHQGQSRQGRASQRGQVGAGSGPKMPVESTTPRPGENRDEQTKPTMRRLLSCACAASSSDFPASWRSTGLISTSCRARSMGCWARTAPASRPC